jgi:uncharacterized repeat protein (TIGR03803 family)
VALLMALALDVPQTVRAQTYSVPYAFPSFPSGAQPMGNPLIAGNKLYGTTDIGGVGEGPYGLGTIYQLDLPTGRETLLHSFAGAPSDGEYPYAGVISDPDGNLYGTTFFGGGHDLGTVFMLSATGTETVLHSFSGLDGGHPDCGLVRDAAGNLYGTATAGGISSSACLSMDGVNHSCGTVFKLDPSGQLSTLHAFTGSPDGANPSGTLYLDAGKLYGSTWDGGASNAGTVFQVDVETGEETVLYSFTGGGDGKSPTTGVIGDGQGALYGGTNAGGGGNGVVFKLPITGIVETVLFTFSGVDGASPSALTLGAQGELYGTTYDGARGYGTLFELDSRSGAMTTIHRFRSGADGANPTGLTQDSEGNLYGTTLDGGLATDGTIFRVAP